MSIVRPTIAAAALLACPGPWLLEASLAQTVAQGFSRCADGTGGCGDLGGIALDAGGVRLHGLAVQRRGLEVRARHAEVRPAWDGLDVHLEGLEIARASNTAPPTTPSPEPNPKARSPLVDTHGLTVRVHATGTTVLREAGLTVLLDEPSLSVGPDGVPHASAGLSVQHPRGSLHSGGRLRAVARGTLQTWAVTGTVHVADGPPLRLRGQLDPDRVRAELEHEGGGWIHLALWPQARSAQIEADRFALHGLGRLGRQTHDGVVIDASSATVGGRLELEPSVGGGVSLHASGVQLEGVRVEHAKLSSSPVSLGRTRVDGNATAQGLERFDADLTLGHETLALSVTASRRAQRAALRVELPDGPCQRVFDGLPDGFADAMRGTQVDGTLGGHIEVTVDFDQAKARAAQLAADPLAEPPDPGTLDVDFPFREQCRVVADPAALDVAALTKPYRHRFVDAHGVPRSILVADGAPHTVELEDVPLVAGAFVTLEDARYFKHDGLDLEQVANALWHNLAAGEVQRGASTITQQAARNLFLGLDRTAARKLQEAFVATRIESSVSKRRLLEVYLNIIELAPGVHGVEDAAWFYFGRSAADLTPLQATHLAMMAPAPRTYSERFVSGKVDPKWRADLDAQVRRLARHKVIDRPAMIRALRGELDLVDRRPSGAQPG
ncbi:MAG: biosynthetic peptidoglycan transglycosylase [Nannocystaceae bacterium]|nr:transglycosylase domain-containing protein [bacterium]